MKHLVYIGNQLQLKGNTVSTIDTLGKGLEGLGYKLTYASSKKMMVLRLLDMLWTVFKHRKTADYVLIDTYSTLNFYYALFVSQWCRFLKLNYLPILHGGNLPQRLQSHPKLSQYIFNYAYINISPSAYIYECFKEKGYHCQVIPNSLELSKYPYTERPIKTIKLLWVRSFSKIYNPTLAVDVLEQLLKKGYEASLCMVGPEKDGSLASTKAYAQSKAVAVTFTGKLSKNEWIQRAKDYNVFINTTNFDNMPVSVIEAMALGLPIVSTNVGGLPYLITNNKHGLLVQPNDTDAFVKAITVLLNNTEFTQTLTKNARAKAESFDWTVVKSEWEFILK